MMRGTDDTSGSLFSYVDLEARIPAHHAFRKVRQVVNDALASLGDHTTKANARANKTHGPHGLLGNPFMKWWAVWAMSVE